MVNANQKGKRFERETAKMISRIFNVDCKRVPNSGGLDIKGDIMSLTGIPARFNWECKNQEKLNIWKALEQSERDARGSRKDPIVVFTKNFTKPLTMK